ncbi:PTS cellobiose transporter subunit IIC [Sporolactobacillus terrae]|uniref:PTS cellobiose transporter subunit IIC n=1 Tax=Sporolactobacillus terrae TaxID=269673 RepID=UPI00048F1C0F|nr:PTS cellobiose transporter subunit IIC [Sporolactobacillus terrae]
MNGLSNFLERYFMPVAGRLAGVKHLIALRDGIMLAMPLIIIGSVFLILTSLPIPGYTDFMAAIFGAEWATKLGYPINATFGIMGLVASFGIAYYLAEQYEVDALSAGIISLSAFLLATPFQIPYLPDGASKSIMVDGGIPVALMGSKGLFVAMIIAMLSTEIYRFFVNKEIVIKMPNGVPPAVSKSFVALIPGAVVILGVWLLRLLVEATSLGSLHDVVGIILAKPLAILGTSLIGSLIAVFLWGLLWSCGLHGGSIVGGVMSAIWLSAMDENRIAFQNHQPLPHVVTTQFFDLWVFIGGGGATLALVIIMLFRARSKQMKDLSRLTIAPAIFNINEPLIFGMPIVLNPVMIIPFILTPLLTVFATYIGMSLGWVAKPAGILVPWTMPPLISGYLATGGRISGAVMQLVDIVIAFVVYYPFFSILDKQTVKMESEAEQEIGTGNDVDQGI